MLCLLLDAGLYPTCGDATCGNVKCSDAAGGDKTGGGTRLPRDRTDAERETDTGRE